MTAQENFTENCNLWVAEHQTALTRLTFYTNLFRPILDKLSDTVKFNLAGTDAWVEVCNREDLQVVMTLTQLWTKTTGGKTIYYEATFEKNVVKICAYAAALPPTCRVVTKTTIIPERVETIETVVCDAL